MSDLISKLKRQIWLPSLLISGLVFMAAVLFSVWTEPKPVWIWVYAAVVICGALLMASMLTHRIAAPVQHLAQVVEQISPEALKEIVNSPDEMSALAETVSALTSELREKEQTWIGDLERRNQAMQQMSRTLQEQAASFETALNSVDLPVCLFESSGNLLQVNQRFCQYLGTAMENLKTMSLLAIVSSLRKSVAAPEELTAAAEAIYRKPSAPRDGNFSLIDGRGTLRLYCVPIFGELSSLVGIIISVAEGPDTMTVDRLKTEFISTVSHELRTPLTAIKGAVGLVLGGAAGPIPGPTRDLLDIAANNTERLIQLVTDILEIFRMESARMRLDPKSTALPGLVARAWNKLEKEAAASRISLETRFSPELPAILVDPPQVQMVIERLLSNAVKFSDAGNLIRIGAEVPPEDPKFVLFWVQDSGKGIPPETQERIFERFEQADSAENMDTRQYQGSGLGLALCRGVVESHGGRIWLRSELGKGSTFFGTLPVADAGESEKASRLVSRRPPSSADPHRLIMVVDDDPDTRGVLARMLQSEGHFVVEVGQGSEVADLAVRHQPEVITLDLILPDVDGLMVLHKLKSNPQTRRIPVICISGSDDLSPEAMRLGAANFIRKPMEMEALLRAIESVCSTVAEPRA